MNFETVSKNMKNPIKRFFHWKIFGIHFFWQFDHFVIENENKTFWLDSEDFFLFSVSLFQDEFPDFLKGFDCSLNIFFVHMVILGNKKENQR